MLGLRGEAVQDDIQRDAQALKDKVQSLSDEEYKAYSEKQREQYNLEYSNFIGHYRQGKCCICQKPFKTISQKDPCLHWLLRRCNFRKKDFKEIIERFDFHRISSYLRWIAKAESGVQSINNLKEESSDRKVFEITIRWKNIEWTLDCSKNDFEGHSGSKTDFPHWHFQMRINGRQFINFNDYHIPFSKDDQLKIVLDNDPDSEFHSFGPAGEGMQEHMNRLAKNPEEFIMNATAASNLEEGSIHMQSIVRGCIPSTKIDEVQEMAKRTGKTFAHCLREVLAGNNDVSIITILGPADSVPVIAKRTEHKRR